MSLILDALNRSRREQHNAAPIPGVDSVHYEDREQANPWPMRGLAAALLLALLVIAALLWREFGRQPLPPAAVPIPAGETQAATTAAKPAGERLAVTTPQAAESQLPAAGEPEPRAPPAAVANTAAGAGVAEPAVVLPPEVAALYATRSEESIATIAPPVPQAAPAPAVPEPAPPAATVSEDSIDFASLLSAAEQALEDLRLAEHPAPFLADLSQQRKDAIPTLMYLQHDYRAGGGSTVTINGEQARAGQTVGRGVRVEDILPDSVVLSYDGQQFRLRALNSWVNL